MEWLTVATLIVSVIALMLSVVASAAVVALRLGKIEGRISELSESMGRVHRWMEDAPCGLHSGNIKGLDKRMERVEHQVNGQ